MRGRQLTARKAQLWYGVHVLTTGRRFPTTWHTWADSPDHARSLIEPLITDATIISVEQQHR